MRGERNAPPSISTALPTTGMETPSRIDENIRLFGEGDQGRRKSVADGGRVIGIDKIAVFTVFFQHLFIFEFLAEDNLLKEENKGRDDQPIEDKFKKFPHGIARKIGIVRRQFLALDIRAPQSRR